MAKKRINPGETGASLLISTVNSNSDSTNCKQQSPEEKSVEPLLKEKRKQRGKPDYESLFIQKSDFKARTGKAVYIRPEYHDRISKIVWVIGEGKISISDYIDHVLTHHFENFRDEIIRIYNEKDSNIF
jgi:hypothetical protein